MTDPQLPPAPPLPPVVPVPVSAVEPWQRRFEVLAVLLVATVVVALVSALINANAQLNPGDEFAVDVGQPGGIGEVVRIAGSSAGFATAGALLVALLLVTLGPGDRIGSLGTFVLRILVGVGLVTAGLGTVSSFLTVSRVEELGTSQVFDADMAGEGLVSRLSAVAPLLTAAVISGYVAWCAFSTLGEVRWGPEEDGAAGRLS